MPEIWKNKRSETGKRNANLKHYICIRQRVLPAYALLLVHWADFFFELHGLIGAKFCTRLGSVYDFIILFQNLEGASPKKFRGEKHARFSPI